MSSRRQYNYTWFGGYPWTRADWMEQPAHLHKEELWGPSNPHTTSKLRQFFWLLFRVFCFVLLCFVFISFMSDNISWTFTPMGLKLNPKHSPEVADFITHIQEYSMLLLNVRIRISIHDMRILVELTLRFKIYIYINILYSVSGLLDSSFSSCCIYSTSFSSGEPNISKTDSAWFL